MLYRRGFTYGGTDTLAKILQKTVFKYATLAELLMVINGLTIVASYFVLCGKVVLYEIINHVVCTKLLDYVACKWDYLFKNNLKGELSNLLKMTLVSERVNS
ncbi:YitT family protein [Terrisporobacter mayombei]|nr:YitT family protein [Terrisporobacter mayombei]